MAFAADFIDEAADFDTAVSILHRSFQGRFLNGLTSIRGASAAANRLSVKAGFLQWVNRSWSSPRLVREVRRCEQGAASLTDQELRTQAGSIRNLALGRKKTDPKSVSEYSGLIGEAVFRTFGFRMHDVQIRGMLAGFGGAIVEMQTGEGKTVVTGAMAALQGLRAKSIHVATTNAYLAARDREELVPVFERLGLTSGILPEETDQDATVRAYKNDITCLLYTSPSPRD